MANPDDLLNAARYAADRLAASRIGSDQESQAANELLIAFRALDAHLGAGAIRPTAWTPRKQVV